jgi:predicted MFS family arabinose efflux permease
VPKQSAYKRYLLLVLLTILAFNYVDRLALGLVLQDIKMDLRLSDTQLGLLTGIAFALFYSLMGIPLARWADRGNRVQIISLTAAVWSVAVALSGIATSFIQLLLIRVGVAVGEAGCMPPAHSLIAHTFTRAERPRAVARYMLGVPLSVVIGYFLAGWINELYGWRAMFVILGLPGLALALLARLTLREPRDLESRPVPGRSDGRSDPAEKITSLRSAPPALAHVCATLWANASFRHLVFCFSVMSFFGFGIQQWQPAFFVRSYGLKTSELGTWLALIYGVGGILGTYWGGEWASRRATGNERLQLQVMAVMCCCLGVISAFVYLASNLYIALGLMALAATGGAITAGPMFASIQTLVPENMRAVSIALIYLSANLVGMGLGPLAAGALSDVFRPLFGEESLRYSLLSLCPGYLWGGWHLWRASATVAKDLAAVERDGHRASEVPG